mmetsp:Transcript_6218/g.9079  ORF Transcript_6218/g.9079 Transcript_6218/m.9079 type:complete len:450 (-) Transcript_6218:846-2195(-)|eukprot:CAMPEP_0196813708 /NCGR_PEP_ID=MMETSP1362-20130617/38522_1 /TAXON_ID=163516 /ORGANISM="Leptocylindrus danicus, Strain CCMP1856" /LENGTH=449 /DNA_ID=CAMNT_0042190049 /DNA_START=37 /DNA_END=1386 /DNA_ORIENTATION=-
MNNSGEANHDNERRMNNDKRERDSSSNTNQHPYGMPMGAPMGVYYFPPNYQNVQGYQQFPSSNDGMGSNIFYRPSSGDNMHQRSSTSRPSAILESSSMSTSYDHHHASSEVAQEPSPDTPTSQPKPTRPKRKKPKDKPKRPLSAYNIFFREERANILAQATPGGEDAVASAKPGGEEGEAPQRENKRPKKKRKKIPHGKVTFENLAKMIGSRWKEMPPSRLQYYQDLADKDTIRYEEEMSVWSQKMKDAKAKSAKEMKEKRETEISLQPSDEEENDKLKDSATEDRKKSAVPDGTNNLGHHVGQRHDEPGSLMSNPSWSNAGQYNNYPPILMMPSMPVPNAIMPSQFPVVAADNVMINSQGQRQAGEMQSEINNNFSYPPAQHQMPQVMMPRYMMGQNQGYMPMGMNYPVQNVYMPYATGSQYDNERARGVSGGRGAGDYEDNEAQQPR